MSSSGSAKRQREDTASSFSEEDQLLDETIKKILADWRIVAHGTIFSESLIRMILLRAREILLSEPMLVPVEAPVNICGDIHGQIHDLSVILETGKPPPLSRYLFLGDYVDRGKFGVECICLLLGLKVLYPGHVFVLRGNHETTCICRMYGFFDECKRRYNVKTFKLFTEVFMCLPVAALVEGVVLCMHGGISPELRTLDQIRALERPVEPAERGLLCDILWSDPHAGIAEWGPNERGVSYTFGAKALANCMEALDVDLVVRAHQVMDQGYQFFGGRSLVTVFSASNYVGEFTNSGAMLQMDADLKCAFQIFKPKFQANGKVLS